MEAEPLVFALLAALFAALVAIFGKIGLAGVDSNTATAIRAVVMALFLLAVVAYQGKLSNLSSLAKNNNALFFILLSGIAGALSWLFYFLALQGGKVSQVAPIDRTSAVFAAMLAALFLGESITLQSALGISLIVAGGIIIALS